MRQVDGFSHNPNSRVDVFPFRDVEYWHDTPEQFRFGNRVQATPFRGKVDNRQAHQLTTFRVHPDLKIAARAAGNHQVKRLAIPVDFP